jgi:hypothetical protein
MHDLKTQIFALIWFADIMIANVKIIVVLLSLHQQKSSREFV